MRRISPLACFLLAISGVVRADELTNSFESRVKLILKSRCANCHSGSKAEAKLDLVTPRDSDQLRREMREWFRVLDRVTDGSMPPADADPLTAAERTALVKWVREDYAADLRAIQQQEGRSKFRRFNRHEFAHTFHDLFGFRPPAMRELPIDGRVDGYDKVSSALPMSSAHAAGYLKIVDDQLNRMLHPVTQKDRTYRVWAAPSEASQGHILELADGTKVSFNTDTTSCPIRSKSESGEFQPYYGTRVPGKHKLKISAYAYQSDKPIAFGIYVGHIWAYPQLIELTQVLEAPPGKPTILEAEIYLHTTFDNDLASVSDGIRLIPFGLGVQVPKNSQASDCKGPGLALQWIDIEEPELPLAGDRWLTADMSADFQKAITQPGTKLDNSKLSRDELQTVMTNSFRRIGMRLFRRALTEAETAEVISRFLTNVDAGTELRQAYLKEISRLLTSPDYLCVIEQPGKLNDFALASRLSFFLWNSTPDEELIELAHQGKLGDPPVLHAQTERLLNDSRSQRFVNDFLDQWLGLWGIDNTTPDKDIYPEFDDELKISSVMETRETFRRMLDKNHSVRDFIAPSRMLVNARLARHYGLSNVQGFSLQEVAIPKASPFGGLWTQASVMKVTANGTLTSPIKRGVWMAERLMGKLIPPPPPNIEPVNPDTRGAKTLREQLALHSSQTSCKSCHAKFDPYGFALESFDVMGGFRKNYREADLDFEKLNPQEKAGRTRWREGAPVDCSGMTPDGVKFADIQALRQWLVQKPEMLANGLARHLVTYATGTPVSRLDEKLIDEIVRNSSSQDFGIRSIVHEVVKSDLFRSK